MDLGVLVKCLMQCGYFDICSFWAHAMLFPFVVLFSENHTLKKIFTPSVILFQPNN